MAWATKYRCEFYDVKGLDWKWDFELDGYSGSVNTMQASGDPATYEPLSDADDLLENPVRGIKAALRVKSTSLSQYSEFYTLFDLQMRCSIYHGATLYFRGYVLPYSFSEPYNDYPYDVTITVTCGLAALRSMKYEASAGVPYYGWKKESQILLDVLGKIGMTTFAEIINVYEQGMEATTDDSPIDQTSINVSIFDGMYCYEVLEHLLNKWVALIRQRWGVFYIYRPNEMIITAYVRTFTAVTTKTGSTLLSVSPLLRSTSPDSDLRDVNGGSLMLIPPAKKLTMNQDYGWRESWILNYDLKEETFDGTDFTHWTQSTGADVRKLSEFFPEEKQGALLHSKSTGVGTWDKYIEQNFCNYGKYSTTDVFTIEFEYCLYNTTASPATGVHFAFEMYRAALVEYLQLTGSPLALDWVYLAPFPAIEVEADSPVGLSAWTKWSYTIKGLPLAGPPTIRLRLFATVSTGIYVAFKNVIFRASSVGTQAVPVTTTRRDRQSELSSRWNKAQNRVVTFLKNIMEKQYNIENVINGEELQRDYLMGDVTDSGLHNVVEQMHGALALAPSTLAAMASRFVTYWAAYYLAGNVVVTSDGADLIFEGTDYVDWTDPATITNEEGDLDGTVATSAPDHIHAVEPAAAVPAIYEADFGSSSSGYGTFGANYVYGTITIITDIYDALNDFVSSYGATFAAAGLFIEVYSYYKLRITTDPAAEFTQIPWFTNGSGDIDATISQIQSYEAETEGVHRKDTITLTGTNGVAGIRVNDLSATVRSDLLDATAAWSTRGGSEADPLLELIGAQMGVQKSRARQLLAIPVYDLDANDTDPHVDVIGCFEDNLNVDDSIFPVRSVSLWSKDRCTLTLVGGYAQFESTSATPDINLGSLSFKGSTHKVISIRYRVVSGSPAAGWIYYQTAGHGFDAGYYKDIALDDDGDWHTMLVDMSDLTAGGTDWVDNVILKVWFYLTDSSGVVVDLDWIGFSRVFAFNRGVYNMKSRRWDIDMVEVIR